MTWISRSSTLTMLGLLVFLASCDDGSNPTAPCEMDCGAHGRCVIAAGHEGCLCDPGYLGEDCAACKSGYVLQGAECAPDPCLDSPCTAPHQGVCSTTDTGFVCLCDDDAQDNDNDGTCRPTCAAAIQGYNAQSCDDSSGEALFFGPRSCSTVVEYTPEAGESVGDLQLRGEFNNWAVGSALTAAADGVYSITLDIPAGDYAYKFYGASADRWFEDPVNPFFKWLNGERNSRLKVEDCQAPYLRLLHRAEVDVPSGAVTLRVQYVDGSAAAGLGPQGIQVSRSGVPVSGTLDGVTHTLLIKDQGLGKGKYGYRIEASDAAGHSAKPLVVPVWVEDQPFEWQDAVLYFALTDRFADGNPSNNAPVPGVDAKANWQGGDFAGLKQKLESGYFTDLGVNAIWISSISQNTGGSGAGDDGKEYAGYHSYWPISTGWTNENQLEGVQPTDPHFGNLQEFKDLVDAAHARGIRVLVDFVANHVHQDSPLWQHHQNDGWFHTPWAGCKETNWEQPITCWFAPYLPDFEYKNAQAVDEVVNHAVWMVEETNIDGFRLDAVKHMIDDFVYSVRGGIDLSLRMSGERFYMVGETFTGEDGSDLLEHYIGPRLLDGQFDFPLYWQVTEVFLREERDLKALESMVGWNDTRYGDWAVMSTFLGNHDVCRALSHAAGDISDMWCNEGKNQAWNSPPSAPTDPQPYRKLRLAWTFLMTSPGVPLIYYGDEFGMEGAGDPDNRRFMRFGADLNGEQAATMEVVKRLTAIRHAHRATRRGERRTIALADDGLLWAYVMEDGDDWVLVVLNRADAQRTQSLDLSALGVADTTLVDALSDQPFEAGGGMLEVTLGGHEAAVFAL